MHRTREVRRRVGAPNDRRDGHDEHVPRTAIGPGPSRDERTGRSRALVPLRHPTPRPPGRACPRRPVRRATGPAGTRPDRCRRPGARGPPVLSRAGGPRRRAPGRPRTCISPQEAGCLSLDHRRTTRHRRSRRHLQDPLYRTRNRRRTAGADPVNSPAGTRIPAPRSAGGGCPTSPWPLATPPPVLRPSPGRTPAPSPSRPGVRGVGAQAGPQAVTASTSPGR